MDQSKQFAIQSFAKQLLDVADNLSRALGSVPAEALEGKKGESALLVTLVEGVRMTDQQLQKVFGANKIVQVGGWLDAKRGLIGDIIHWHGVPRVVLSLSSRRGLGGHWRVQGCGVSHLT